MQESIKKGKSVRPILHVASDSGYVFEIFVPNDCSYNKIIAISMHRFSAK